MTEPPNSKPWDLQVVIDLLHSLSTSKSTSDPFLSAFRDHRKPADAAPISTGLGDFSPVWDYLGTSPPPAPEPDAKSDSCESTSSFASRGFSSDQNSLQSSATDSDICEEECIVKSKEVRWKDEIDGTDLPESRRRSIHEVDRQSFVLKKTEYSPIIADRLFNLQSPSKKSRRRLLRSGSSGADETSGIESEGDLTPRRKSGRPCIYVSDTDGQYDTHTRTIKPLHNVTVEENKRRIAQKLWQRYGISKELLEGPMPKSTKAVNDDAIHVFVDCSNIVVGFFQALRKARLIPEKVHMKQPPLSYQLLAFIMERNRPVARRILVGSRVDQQNAPAHIDEAKKCGYEVNILDRVFKTRQVSPKKTMGGMGNGYLTGQSGSETPHSEMQPKTFVEQGVDEILHMKLLESIVDTHKPSTIVLASGDGAEAEYSGGFLKNVERALLKGWNVEIIAWKQGLSFEYRTKEFRRRWKNQFSVIELDQFSEELLAIYNTS